MADDRDVLLERIEWMMRLAERGVLSTDMRQELSDLLRGLSKDDQMQLADRSYRRAKARWSIAAKERQWALDSIEQAQDASGYTGSDFDGGASSGGGIAFRHLMD